MECPLCSNIWSADKHVPRILSCGHTICESCARSKFLQCGILCEECKSEHKFLIDREFSETDEDYLSKCINSLSKNFTLLSVIGNQRSPQEKIDEFELDYCEDHNLPLHSFSVKPHSELCDMCIAEVEGLGLEIQPLPHVDSYFNTLIQKILTNLHTSKEKIVKLAQRLIENENHETLKAEKTLSTLFEGLLDFLNKTETDLNQKLAFTLKDLHQKNSEIHIKLDQQKETLSTLQSQLNFLTNLQDSDLVRQIEVCDSLAAVHVSEPIAFKSVSFSSNMAKILKLKSFLEKSFKVYLKQQANVWICNKCGLSNQDGLISCSSCKVFRPIESYPGLSRHPSLASEQELHELNLRRQTEIQRISQLDKIDPKGVYYLIHAGWLGQWKNFVLNKTSANAAVVILPPGPICNGFLFQDGNCTIVKHKLKASTDYRGVNQEVWMAYLEIYGGGPEIKRNKVNIYSH